MKTILLYGDSNVWGDTPERRRLPDEQQWANILQAQLGSGYKIIQEGLCGRYAGGFPYDKEPCFNGQLHFEPIYKTASPVDLIIIALGTNDLNKRYNRAPHEIVEDILWYESKVAQLVKDDKYGKMPEFIFVSVANFAKEILGEFNESYRLKVNRELKERTKNFVDLEAIELSSDGLHFSPAGHQQVAEAVHVTIKKLGAI